jgi:hypothetical protein
MKRKLLLSLSLIAGLGIGLFWWSGENTTRAGNFSDTANPLETINQKAKNARSGDISAAEDLVSAVIGFSGFESELDGFTANSMIERIGKAESNYRAGQSAGIPESKIVRTINGLAVKFNLPQFAKTDSYEVRKLRVALLPSFPDLIGQKTQTMQSIKTGSGIEPIMSPAEAVLILSMMMNQKLVNPDYQLTQAERLERWDENHNHRQNAEKSGQLTVNRGNEIQAALKRGAQAISLRDAVQLSDLILNTLGIENLGGTEK